MLLGYANFASLLQLAQSVLKSVSTVVRSSNTTVEKSSNWNCGNIPAKILHLLGPRELGSTQALRGRWILEVQRHCCYFLLVLDLRELQHLREGLRTVSGWALVFLTVSLLTWLLCSFSAA